MSWKELFFSLLRFEICGEPLSDGAKNAVTAETTARLYAFSCAHDLGHLVGDALQKNGLLNGEQAENKKYLQQCFTAVYRYELLQYELDELSRLLEEEKILFVPLKGSLMREHYPQAWMRTSADVDVFVQECDVERVKTLFCEKLSYRFETKWKTEYSFYSESGMHIEVHTALCERGDAQYEVLKDFPNGTVCVEGKAYQRKMTDETYYFYHLAHMAKHLRHGGCGVRPFIDVFLLNKRVSYDQETLNALLQKGGLAKFADVAKALSRVWLKGEPHTAQTADLEEYILRGGTYGNSENLVAVEQVQKGGKFRRLLSLVFLPYDRLKLQYPALEKRKWLLPFYEVKRWCRIIFKGGLKTAKKQADLNDAVSDEYVHKVKALLNDLELN